MGFLGGVFSFGGREGGMEGGVVCDFCVFIDYSIDWDFSLGFFSSFSFLFGNGGFFVFIFLLFALFFCFSFSFLPFLFF